MAGNNFIKIMGIGVLAWWLLKPKYSKSEVLEMAQQSGEANRLQIANKAPESLHDNIFKFYESIVQPLQKVSKFKINSWYRNQLVNNAVGGVPGSFHTFGQSVDLQFPSRSELNKALEKLKDLKYTEVIYYNGSLTLHVAYNGEDERETLLQDGGNYYLTTLNDLKIQ